MSDESITPERLARVEEDARDGMSTGRDARALCTALREAWRERDVLRADALRDDCGAALLAERDTLRAEVARLENTLNEWVSVGRNIMESAVGQRGMLSDSAVIGELTYLRARVAELEGKP